MNIYKKIINLLLEELQERDEEIEERLAQLEAWQQQVEAVWPEVINDGTD